MTPELKEKIKASMNEHLKSKGYPNITNDQIVEELPAMWQKLDHEGLLEDLVKRGMTYQHFVNIAMQTKRGVETMEEIERFFKNRQG